MKREAQKDEFIKKRMERQKRIRKRRLVIGLIVFIILLIAVGVTLSLTVFFPIHTVKVYGSERYTPEEIVASSGFEAGDNIFAFSEKAVEERLRKALPYVETIDIKRKLPDTLEINVTDAAEYAFYQSNGKYYAVSKSGFVLNVYDALPENQFEIRGGKVECSPGSQIVFSDEDEEKLIEKLLSGFDEKKITANYIDITDSLNISAMIDGRFTVDFGTFNNITKKINHLDGMIKSIGEGKAGKINLSMWTSEHTEGTFVEESD